MIYFDSVTKQIEPNVRVNNFSRDDKTIVRIIGSHKLNPEDKYYPDKKWVKISDLYDNVNFPEDYVKRNTF